MVIAAHSSALGGLSVNSSGNPEVPSILDFRV